MVFESNKENIFKQSEESIEHLKHQLSTANTTINQLKEKLESNGVARMQLEQHVQGLNQQINELFGKLKLANIKHTENAENIAFLQRKISTLEHVSGFKMY